MRSLRVLMALSFSIPCAMHACRRGVREGVIAVDCAVWSVGGSLFWGVWTCWVGTGSSDDVSTEFGSGFGFGEGSGAGFSSVGIGGVDGLASPGDAAFVIAIGMGMGCGSEVSSGAHVRSWGFWRLVASGVDELGSAVVDGAGCESFVFGGCGGMSGIPFFGSRGGVRTSVLRYTLVTRSVRRIVTWSGSWWKC